MFQGVRNAAITRLILDHEEVFAEDVDAQIEAILDVPRDPAGFPIQSLDGPIDALCAAYRADKARLEAALAEKELATGAAKTEGELAAKVLKKVKTLQEAVDELPGKDDGISGMDVKRVITDELEKEDGVVTKGFADLRDLIINSKKHLEEMEQLRMTYIAEACTIKE